MTGAAVTWLKLVALSTVKAKQNLGKKVDFISSEKLAFLCASNLNKGRILQARARSESAYPRVGGRIRETRESQDRRLGVLRNRARNGGGTAAVAGQNLEPLGQLLLPGR